MRKNLVFYLFISILISCSVEEPEKSDMKNDAFDEIALESDVDMSVIDNIARKYSSKPLTKSEGYTLSSIRDANGEVAMYVINFADDAGFVVVSATKKYEPILAFSDKGNFNVNDENMPVGVKQWKIDVVDVINKHKSFPADSALRYASFWREFEGVRDFVLNRPKTRSYDYPELDRIMMDSVAIWQSQGYNVYSLYENPTTGDSQLDAQIRAYAEGSILPIYDWQNYSLLIEKEYYEEYRQNNFLKSCWGQTWGFNDYLPMCPNGWDHAYVGCNILAAAQVMRYYEKPDYSNEFPYHLSAMPYDYATNEVALFIKNVFDNFEIKTIANNGTTSNIGETNKTLRKYGYSTNIGNYNVSTVSQNIRQYKPVIIRGTIPEHETANGVTISESGHCWIISGQQQYYGATEWKLYTFVSENELTKVFNGETNQTYYPLMFYMSWGQSGTYDGYYVSSHIDDPFSDTEYESMQIIYNITY